MRIDLDIMTDITQQISNVIAKFMMSDVGVFSFGTVTRMCYGDEARERERERERVREGERRR